MIKMTDAATSIPFGSATDTSVPACVPASVPAFLRSSETSKTHLSAKTRPIARSTTSHESNHSEASSENSTRRFLQGLKVRWGAKLRSSQSSPAAALQPYEKKYFPSSDTTSMPGASTRKQGSVDLTSSQRIGVLASISAGSNTLTSPALKNPPKYQRILWKTRQSLIVKSLSGQRAI